MGFLTLNCSCRLEFSDAASVPHRDALYPSVRSTDLQTVKRELTQIKHKLDFLLESLERMEKEHNRKFGEEVTVANKILNVFQTLRHVLPSPLLLSEARSSKPEPGEVSPVHSSTSSKKEGSLKRDRESQELNDSEEDGDLLDDEDEVSFFVSDV